MTDDLNVCKILNCGLPAVKTGHFMNRSTGKTYDVSYCILHVSEMTHALSERGEVTLRDVGTPRWRFFRKS